MLAAGPLPSTPSTVMDDGKKSSIAKRSRSKFSALPRAKEMREEDDWTRVKDPKQKKRIQNRVAQRTYRTSLSLSCHPSLSLSSHRLPQLPADPWPPGHRMKARLDELQARLDTHEGYHQPTSLPVAAPPTSADLQMPFGLEGSLSPAHHPSMPCVPQQQQPAAAAPPPLDPQFMAASHGFYDASPVAASLSDVEGSPAAFGAADLAMFSSPSLGAANTVPSPPPPASASSYGLLSPPSMPDHTHVKAEDPSPNFMLDCMSFQSQLLDRLNSLQKDAAAVPTTAAAGVAATAPTSAPSLAMGGMDRRLEHVVAQAEAAGFESFDHMVTAYYTHRATDPASPLADEQRLSRRRRLPRVVADVCAASRAWDDWEREGLVGAAGEALLACGDGEAAARVLGPHVSSLLDAQAAGDVAAAADARVTMKRTLQDQLPGLWAVATSALAADAAWQWDRSNAALAVAVLLNFSGRLSGDQLSCLVGACLS